MRRRALLLATAVLVMFAVSSCGMMAKMMGMGDMMSAMNNMDAVMAMSPDEMKQHAASKEAAAWNRGKELFSDSHTGESSNELACNSCHPGGGTTGGEAQVPMREFKMPIPTLVGAAGTFPKYKIPNDEVITLAQMNNNCIRMFMGGKGLAPASSDAYSLETYVASLSNGETVGVGGQMTQSGM
ncbi:MAG: c-type cytochrome [Candidatus Zixiibacteriota bacterium]